MIHDIQGYESAAAAERRMLAVVAGAPERANEVALQFAAQGEMIETRWYATSRELLNQAGRPHFEAVILFPGRDSGATDKIEADLRVALADTPLFCVA